MYWQRTLSENEYVFNGSGHKLYNETVVESVENLATYATLSLGIVGLLVDVACVKWPAAARSLIYIELLNAVFTCLLANETGVGGSQLTILAILVNSICLFCDPLPNLFCTVFAAIWLAFGQIPLVWGLALNKSYVLDSIFIVATVFVVFTAILTCAASMVKLMEK
jgi:hypothetical protein